MCWCRPQRGTRQTEGYWTAACKGSTEARMGGGVQAGGRLQHHAVAPLDSLHATKP